MTEKIDWDKVTIEGGDDTQQEANFIDLVEGNHQPIIVGNEPEKPIQSNDEKENIIQISEEISQKFSEPRVVDAIEGGGTVDETIKINKAEKIDLLAYLRDIPEDAWGIEDVEKLNINSTRKEIEGALNMKIIANTDARQKYKWGAVAGSAATLATGVGASALGYSALGVGIAIGAPFVLGAGSLLWGGKKLWDLYKENKVKKQQGFYPY